MNYQQEEDAEPVEGLDAEVYGTIFSMMESVLKERS